MKLEEVFSQLDASKEGLTSSEAKARLDTYGYNQIEEKRKNPLRKFIGYFWGPIPWMIEVAIIISAAVQRWEDFFIILLLLGINAVVGFWQEKKADDAIELLKKRLAPDAKVRRDGKWIKLQAKELVPGDLVRIRLGDIVPADVKLIEGDYLMVDESALTGESLPVEKSVLDVGYSGSVARQGEMDGLVVTTGMNTFFGKTTKLVEKAETKSHFQKAIVKIGDFLIVLAIIMVAIIFADSVLRNESFTETLQFALVLTIAAIPAALPAVLSVTMAIGAEALAKKEAIVSKLVAIEEMAGMDVLCSDKTGTITKNELSLAGAVTFNDFTENDVILMATLASREEDQDPIDSAVIGRSKELVEIAERVADYEIRKFMPFDPVSKRTESTVVGKDGKEFVVSKGAPQVILDLLPEKEGLRDQLDRAIESFAHEGGRSLGVARTNEDGEWEYMGVLNLSDPPREDSAQTIETAKKMGVDIKMVTGDHTAIAKRIANEVGLGTNIATSESFLDKPDAEAAKVVEEADGFAEVFPEHKYRIVELLQSRDHIVGMTGDGVNDAPALKKADTGIAVAGATDAAKSAAHIVLTKPGLSVIIDAMKQSRMIFQRMTNYAIYRISETLRVLFFITLTILVFNFYPITAVMIVLLAILNDIPIMTIAYDNVKYRDRPQRWNMRLVLGIAMLLGVLGVIETFVLLYIGLDVLNLSHEVLQPFIYLKLSVAGHLCVFMARTKGPYWSVRPAKQLFAAVLATQLIATLITVYGVLMPAMGWFLAAIVWIYALLFMQLIDFVKVQVYKLLDREVAKEREPTRLRKWLGAKAND
jgi:H+-transporting ATPase